MQPPLNGNLSDSPKVKNLIAKAKEDWPLIREKGALAFDIDETLMPPDESLAAHPNLGRSFLSLLAENIKIALISGGPGAVVKNRVVNWLQQNCGSASDTLQNLTCYVNGGSSKFCLTASGEYDEDLDFTQKNLILVKTLHKVKTLIEELSEEYFGIPEDQKSLFFESWLQKRHDQWKGKSVDFADSWMKGEKWQAHYWDDQEMAAVKAGEKESETSFPFINTRAARYDSNKEIESVAGFSIAGFYALKEAKGDPFNFDVRDYIISCIKKALELERESLVLRKAGRSSIDVTLKGADKASALKDFIKTQSLNPSFLFYFGDEFYENGNDQPIVEDSQLFNSGMNFISLNKDSNPYEDKTIWAGRSVASTHQILEEFLKS